MSRILKKQTKKYSKKKINVICRVIFIFLMIIITTSSVLLIDYRINEVLGDDSKFNLTQYLIDIF